MTASTHVWTTNPDAEDGSGDWHLTASQLWLSLKRESRELLLSSRAGAPILADPTVVAGLSRLGLINPDLTLTETGVSVVVNR